ncbi:MAG: PHP domain-containing protein [Lachnospiraceae bacterium]|nr:PHP domain-containing protein [Lachnospiraceae bacterium]
MTEFIDLHVHSTCSDGTLTPEELVQLSAAKGLRAFALTDHDQVSGIERARREALRLGGSPQVIPGIEISSEWQNSEIHILGYDLDPAHPALQSYLDEFLKEREDRNRKMAEKITAAGCPVTVEEVTERFPEAVLGRPHYARIMVEKGFVTSVAAAFQQYLGDQGPCYVNRRRIPSRDAVQLILSCGGHPVLAHPLQYGFSKDRLESFAQLLKDSGLEGMECLYSGYSVSDSEKLMQLAKRHGLFVTGGSDFHGANKPQIELGTGINGNLAVPYSLLSDAGIC